MRSKSMYIAVALLALSLVCAGASPRNTIPERFLQDGEQPQILVDDLGLVSGFQDYSGNHYKKGRALVAGDFDLDGRVDFFVGNPGDESLVYRNLGLGADGVPRFEAAQILLQGDLAFVASAADYDNDGDLDLFVGCGGLDGRCLDFLFRNDSTPGRIHFTNVTREAGVAGPLPSGSKARSGAPPALAPAEAASFGEEGPLIHSTLGATWGDYDRDGDQDLFVSISEIDWTAIPYRSVLWRNRGDGTFQDATVSVGLAYWSHVERDGGGMDWGQFMNSTWIDADNDGDLDLFLNNANGPNVLWKNLLVEMGEPWFREATREFSLPGEDLRFPRMSFASAVADFNNDGWQDLMLFAVGQEPTYSPYGNGNGFFLNKLGQGFFNAASLAGVNMPDRGFEVAMGCQVADVNADGIPDLAIGTGAMWEGRKSCLFLSKALSGEIPLYDDASALLDLDTPHGINPAIPPYPEIPPYPYRSHGMAFADFDGDGHLELGMANGGPAAYPETVREPNRLFHFSGPGVGRTFRARLSGNGVSDSRDAIGARAWVETVTSAGARRIYQTVLGGSGFSAQNELTLTFGLGGDGAVSRLAILWASGCLQVLDAPPGGFSSPLAVDQACWACPSAPGPVQAWLTPETYGCSQPPPCRVEGTVQDSFGSVPWARVVHLAGEASQSLFEGRTDADGAFSVEHPAEPDDCQTFLVEPFGYLPLPGPVQVDDGEEGTTRVQVVLQRATEHRSPRGTGYWFHQTKALVWGKGRSQETAADLAVWGEEIHRRYPGLAGLFPLETLAATLEGKSSRLVPQRLRAHLVAALMNLASSRLSSFTLLDSGERVGDLVEAGYREVSNPGADPARAEELSSLLEALNEGSLSPR